MQQVPTVVKLDGKPIHHGTVEHHFDNLRAIIQMYVTDVQEARRLPSPPFFNSCIPQTSTMCATRIHTAVVHGHI